MRPPIDWARIFYQLGSLVLLVVLGYAVMWICGYLAGVLYILVSALLVAYVLQLLVDPLSRRMPRLAAVAIVVVLVLMLASAAGSLLVPLVVLQVQELLKSVPVAADRLHTLTQGIESTLATRNVHVQIHLENLVVPRLQDLSAFATSHVGAFLTSGFFSFFSVAMTLVMAFYFLKDGQRLWQQVRDFIPEPARTSFTYFQRELDRSLNAYFRGQVINASVVLGASTVAFTLVGMSYGVVGGLIWGLAEIIPMFGTYIGIGTCLLLAALQGGGVVLKVALAALAIQQTKDNIISPRVMSHTTGLHPVVIISAVLVGMRMAGFLGILLAIPLTAVAVATLRVYLHPPEGSGDAAPAPPAEAPEAEPSVDASVAGLGTEARQSSTPPS